MHLTEAYHLIQNAHSPEQKEQLAFLLNKMIEHDFEGLVQLLYRVDVPEQAVKKVLQQQPHTDAGLLLAGLLLKRQEQKAALRKQAGSNNNDIADEDRW